MTWEKIGSRVMPRHILDYDMSEEQPEFNWMTLYRESNDPRVEPVATSREPSPDQEGEPEFDRACRHRTHTEMEFAFDPQRMAGEDVTTTKRRQRQQRLFNCDAFCRFFTGDVQQASRGNPFRFKSQLYWLRQIQACELVAHAWRKKKPSQPNPPTSYTGRHDCRPRQPHHPRGHSGAVAAARFAFANVAGQECGVIIFKKLWVHKWISNEEAVSALSGRAAPGANFEGDAGTARTSISRLGGIRGPARPVKSAACGRVAHVAFSYQNSCPHVVHAVHTFPQT